jgi:FixJ family two-component response regulator
MSGYPPEIFHKEREWKEGADFIAKPILTHELLRKVREALDG